MKILIVSQHYWPENFSITNIAENLFVTGNSVTVLCGTPNYGQDSIYKEYKKRKNVVEERNGVAIVRAKEIARKNDIVHRFLNYYSFYKNANKLINKLSKDFDVVLVNELSPIMSCIPAIKYKKKYGAKILMYEMDLWPESLLAGGIKKDSFIYKHYRKVSSNIYSKIDKILVSTKEHIPYLKDLPKCRNIEIEYLPQFSEKMFEKVTLKEKTTNTFNFMFAGNIGKAQNLDIIIDAANLLKENKNAIFHIVGDGCEKRRLEEKVKVLELKNIIFHGSKPKEEMPKYYENADVMIVTLVDSEYTNITVPGKVQTYMAASKPILCAAKGSTCNLINEAKCGVTIDSLNAKEFANAALKMCDKAVLKEYGDNAKKFYKDNFDIDFFMSKLISELWKLSKNN